MSKPTTTKCVHCKEDILIGDEAIAHYQNEHSETMPKVAYINLAEMVRESPRFKIEPLGRGLELVELA